MASEPIRSTSVVTAPKDYSIPNAQQIRLLSVRASFTDNGAGGDWLPALQILDNNGNVLVTAADQGVKVTAGNDADVSWFPGVKVAAAAAASSAISYAWGWRDSNSGDPTFDFNIGQQRFVPFLHTSTSNAAVMNWRTISSAFDVLDLKVPGLYDLKLFANLTALEDWAMFLRGDAQDQAAHTAIATTAQSGALSPPRGIDTHQDYTVYNVTGSASVRAYVQNNTGFARQTFGYWYTAAYLGVPA